MIKPYYQDDQYGITIYHGDCRDILPELFKVDLVLTDPPYGVEGSKKQNCGINAGRAKGMYISSFCDDSNYIKDVVVEIISLCIDKFTNVVLTPGNLNFCSYPQPDSFGCFYQPASIGLQKWGNADSQPIFYYGLNPTKKNCGTPCSYQLTEQPEKNGHPCVKPIKIWTKLLSNTSLPNMTILDPFMGSGTTLVAAKQLNRKAIGIEIEEKYCEIAVKRLQQGVFQF